MADGKKIARLLLAAYPDAGVALRFSNPLELLVATMLSAQCTDARVNEVTRTLFRDYRTAGDYAEADPQAFEQAIRSTGFYKSKAQRVIECCRKLVRDYQGKVPQTLEALVTLPGVGRKTANFVLGAAYGQQAIAVDTHVARVSRRLGLAHADDPDRIEAELMEVIPRAQWTAFTFAMIRHGREVCTARAPRCGECVLYEACEWPDKPARPAGAARRGRRP